MHGHKPLPSLDEGQKIFPLSGSDLRMICVEKQSIEAVEVFGIVEGLSHTRDVIEINRIPTKGLRKNREIFIRVMMLGLVSEKKDADRTGERFPTKGTQDEQKEEESQFH